MAYIPSDVESFTPHSLAIPSLRGGKNKDKNGSCFYRLRPIHIQPAITRRGKQRKNGSCFEKLKFIQNFHVLIETKLILGPYQFHTIHLRLSHLTDFQREVDCNILCLKEKGSPFPFRKEIKLPQSL